MHVYWLAINSYQLAISIGSLAFARHGFLKYQSRYPIRDVDLIAYLIARFATLDQRVPGPSPSMMY